MVKVSVIMPVYNSEEYLKETINCVLKQTLTDIELICIDDGSTDSSLRILLDMENKDSRIHIIHQDNCGAGHARNVGMSIATGEYLSFLDSDDIFDSKMLEDAYENATVTGADIVIFKSDLINQKTGEISHADWALRPDMIDNKDVFNPRDYPKTIFQFCNGWPWDKLFKRKMIKTNDIKFQNTHFFNDTLFVFSSLVYSKTISILNKKLATKRQNAGSGQLSLNRSRYWVDFDDVVDALWNLVDAAGCIELYRQSLMNYSVHIALVMMSTTSSMTNQYLKLFLTQTYSKKINFDDYNEDYFYKKEEYREFKYIIEEKSRIVHNNNIGGLKTYYWDSGDYKEEHYCPNRIPIILAADEKYARQMYVTLYSLLCHKHEDSEYIIYMLIPRAFRRKDQTLFQNLLGQFCNFELRFIVMGNLFENIKTSIAHITSPTYYRLVAPKLIPYKKCIYLDVDVIVLCDLKELYDTDLGDDYIAGVKAPAYHCHRDGNIEHCNLTGLKSIEQYVNAGVLLLNLEQLSKKETSDKLIELASNEYPSQDQDVLNIVCYNHIKFLKCDYNVMTKYDLEDGRKFNQLVHTFGLKETIDAYRDPKIIHYADKRKPWKDIKCIYSDIWWKYCSETPYYKEMWDEMKSSFKKPRAITDFMTLFFTGLKEKGIRYYVYLFVNELRK